MVDDLESMKNLSAHIDEEMSALKKEFKVLNRPGTNIFCKGSVDTTILGVDTMVQNKGRNVKESPSQVDTSPGQVDTREPSQKGCFAVWDMRSTLNHLRLTQETSPRDLICQSGECVDTPHGQVDTLWNLYDLIFLLDTWHPREKVDQPWILCPRTPRVSFGYLRYKYPPNGHPSTREPSKSLQKLVVAARESLLSVLLPLALPDLNSPFSKHKDRRLINMKH
ncbi:hypothetical protein Taro_033422 [Colocasia esculenta]|uniref:Uncharacterized protein n=1 Tax=Colocasia esculenta TaxID=4460 RepID=A0A843W8Z5_COLES|nr:hypothetical protein [Colocasia esculenta]